MGTILGEEYRCPPSSMAVGIFSAISNGISNKSAAEEEEMIAIPMSQQ
jgi:hypothetical protein